MRCVEALMVEQALRKKPWYRLRNLILGALALIVLCLGWAFFEVWKVYTGEPKITRDYRAEFRKLSEKSAGVPEGSGDDAWRILADAASQCKTIMDDYRARIRKGEAPARLLSGESDNQFIEFGFVVEGKSVPNRAEREIAAMILLRQQGVFDRLSEFAALGVGFRTGNNSQPMISELLVEYSDMRELAKARVASMRLTIVNGD